MAPLQLKVGDARVTVFNVGDMLFGLDEAYDKSVDLPRYFSKEQIGKKAQFPTQSFLIESGEVKVVVDPSDYARLTAPGRFSPPPGYVLPPPLLSQLEGAGVLPGDVTHVVVTHLHFDHYAGVTTSSEGSPSLAFPAARYIIPKKDWEMPDFVEEKKKGDRDIVDTLMVVDGAGRLELLDRALDLGGGVTVEPYPGESPGHQVVGVRSRGSCCYCVGDLFHFKEEVEHPELVAAWNEPEQAAASRKRFYGLASEEGALVIPGHMRVGRISMEEGQASWTDVSPQPR